MPHNYFPRVIAYTGTHDNNTTLGWLRSLRGDEKRTVRNYLGAGNRNRLQNAIRMIWSSCAETTIIPMQDLLMLGEKSRMNKPGTAAGNWQWRFCKKQLRVQHIKFLEEITIKFNRDWSATT